MPRNDSGRQSSHEFVPIPSYAEATARAESSTSLEGCGGFEVAGNANTIRLLRPGGYQHASVESARTSQDSEEYISPRESLSPSHSDASEDIRREIEEMDFYDPTSAHSRAAGRLSTTISSLTKRLSSIHLPLRIHSCLPDLNRVRRRFPTVKLNYILLTRCFALLFVLFLAYLLFVSGIFRHGHRRSGGRWFDPDMLRSWVRDGVDESNVKSHIAYLSSFDHIAGTAGGQTQALYVEKAFRKSLKNVRQERFDVYLNYPSEDLSARKVAITHPEDMVRQARLEEDDSGQGDRGRRQTQAFFGYTHSGASEGPLIFVGNGSTSDYEDLQNHGLHLKGAIALIRGDPLVDPAIQVMAAQQAEIAGCVIFTDASQAQTEGTHGEWPYGSKMPDDVIKRGSLAKRSHFLGDILSPGFPSSPEESRRDNLSTGTLAAQIPSVPIAWRDAKNFLQTLEGRGFHFSVNETKSGANRSDFWSGDAKSPTVLLQDLQDIVERQPIYNILGSIEGIEQSEKVVIVGNHRDAFCLGASNPGGGTAILLELTRLFGELTDLGWAPRRTIVFASWDAGAYNLIGATEHVESRIEDLRQDAFAYVDIGVAAIGSTLRTKASPSLQNVILRAFEGVAEPNGNRTLRAAFAEAGSLVETIDASSDHAPFQMIAGCSSLAVGFDGSSFPDQSCHDDLEWVEMMGDPELKYHKALAQVMTLLILDLSDRDIIPLDLTTYAKAVDDWVEDLVKTEDINQQKIDVTNLTMASATLKQEVETFHAWSKAWTETVHDMNQGTESMPMAMTRMSHNDRVAQFESHLLDLEHGLPGREQFKHVIFAPDVNEGASTTSIFPGIRDALVSNNATTVQEQLDRVAQIILSAARRLSS